MSGKLWGVGLGPGDPELVTVKAARVIGAADVIAFHSARHGRSISRGIAAPYMRAGQLEEHLVYPVTTETTDHPGGYQGAIDEFYESAAALLADHLAAGRSVALLAAGDPLFYSSFMHMHRRLADRFDTEIIPGVTSVSAASAALGTPLVEGDQVLTVLPGTMPVDELTRRLRETDAAAIMKLGRTYPGVRQALSDAGRLDDAYYVERASSTRQRVLRAADVDDASVPYFAITVVPGPEPATPIPLTAAGVEQSAEHETGNASPAEAPAPSTASAQVADAADSTSPASATAPEPVTDANAECGEVVVVGLGPGAAEWTTPEVTRALAEATDIVGYSTYVNRVPERPGQRRHASDNRVESERAAMALDLAKRGGRVAVVSSGDPGVFAMAAAVIEESADPQWRGVPVRVLPGMTAASAVASRVGAPLGHDFAMISLSDRLKPWEVVVRRIAAVAAADMAFAVYNPASSQRTWQVAAMRELVLEHRKPDTPVVLGRDVGGPTESVRVVTLADLDPAEVDMRTLLIVGASSTTVFEAAGGPRVFTSRRYTV
ncbi:precorrin-2 C(20)-methyltransferase [Nocardia otitidiscaviarum]|uniref:precorrin-2 C(20)-methyltransferase n=1 Tax=Nocardia otitidiscaviarum TaxID=1823 RepID=UPI0004A6DDE1|nr:precorrin-2 C(20)-methyltransferase [Nocardia otitidiscaviarum]MBF6136535.1 precorrin-2 C(20)-methyltransferase [Nocardia otitidiscaviarum]MBF6484737.1 precorrin-2 C(20)-methyltransferase [Nocardia otitidiscaviarum]